ncbi:cytochrome c-type biogenesis protein CcmB [Alkalidesulfovibrio alkalitolerans DSM 16529]|uniref:Cytochrome c-type biogenesis protein CcmB n=1 Tax=Alkalidesulfovibrio alkalitolerans DSM 16529 TaxID=1121439 RepID=S7UGU3_9BACT|nr:heme exporter protein CcmB [Alkalidesulfovibrio alkalitolerans]EPR31463.1 cytochrome c-type biogenesis protein CcmB [Alkalidesulfovibrio alkalitolerans DSM 16529]
MLRPALAIASKDLRMVFAAGQGLAQALLLGLLLVFLFSLSRAPGEATPALAAAVIFWLSTAFALILFCNTLYGFEDEAGARQGLLLSPAPPQAVWLGKALACMALLLLVQAVFAPAVIVFLGQGLGEGFAMGLFGILVVDWGLCCLGALLGALAHGQSAKESLLSIILFPLLVPALLAGVKTLAFALGAEDIEGPMQWLALGAAFDALFTAGALVLYPFVFCGDE